MNTIFLLIAYGSLNPNFMQGASFYAGYYSTQEECLQNANSMIEIAKNDMEIDLKMTCTEVFDYRAKLLEEIGGDE